MAILINKPERGFLPDHPQDGPIEVDILPAGQLGVKAGGDLPAPLRPLPALSLVLSEVERAAEGMPTRSPGLTSNIHSAF